MTILKKIKKVKLGLYFGIVGFIIAILFLILLILNHWNLLKVNTIFKDFMKDSSYTIVLCDTDEREKNKLFDYENLHFYGYGVKDIKIQYNGRIRSLKEIFRTKKITLEDFLKNYDFVFATEDQTIQKYTKEDITITIENFYENTKEIIISKL